jgi:acetyltransferase-like isoleucine patch superfamily enzyme
MKLESIGIKSVEFGSNVTVVEPVNLYGCVIKKDSFIGPFVEIQKNVTVGERVKIQSHTFVCELVEIGNDCFIGHGVMFINDLFSEGKPSNGKKILWKHTRIGNNVSIGSNATILPVDICANVVIGAGSVVTKNIKKSGVYVGNPAKKLRENNG